MSDPLLTLKEAAKYLNVGQSTLYQNLRSGRWDIPVVRLRSKLTKSAGRVKSFIRFRQSDLDAWVASQVLSGRVAA